MWLCPSICCLRSSSLYCESEVTDLPLHAALRGRGDVSGASACACSVPVSSSPSLLAERPKGEPDDKDQTHGALCVHCLPRNQRRKREEGGQGGWDTPPDPSEHGVWRRPWGRLYCLPFIRYGTVAALCVFS